MAGSTLFLLAWLSVCAFIALSTATNSRFLLSDDAELPVIAASNSNLAVDVDVTATAWQTVQPLLLDLKHRLQCLRCTVDEECARNQMVAEEYCAFNELKIHQARLKLSKYIEEYRRDPVMNAENKAKMIDFTQRIIEGVIATYQRTIDSTQSQQTSATSNGHMELKRLNSSEILLDFVMLVNTHLSEHGVRLFADSPIWLVSGRHVVIGTMHDVDPAATLINWHKVHHGITQQATASGANLVLYTENGAEILESQETKYRETSQSYMEKLHATLQSGQISRAQYDELYMKQQREMATLLPLSQKWDRGMDRTFALKSSWSVLKALDLEENFGAAAAFEHEIEYESLEKVDVSMDIEDTIREMSDIAYIVGDFGLLDVLKQWTKMKILHDSQRSALMEQDAEQMYARNTHWIPTLQHEFLTDGRNVNVVVAAGLAHFRMNDVSPVRSMTVIEGLIQSGFDVKSVPVMEYGLVSKRGVARAHALKDRLFELNVELLQKAYESAIKL